MARCHQASKALLTIVHRHRHFIIHVILYDRSYPAPQMTKVRDVCFFFLLLYTAKHRSPVHGSIISPYLSLPLKNVYLREIIFYKITVVSLLLMTIYI
jgi:hypothetical protein